MEINNYLRLAILLGDSQAKTFNSNLCKMISLIIYDNNNNKLNIVDIVYKLKEKYNLEFDSIEVLKAIKSNKKNFLEYIDADPQYNSYILCPKEYKKLQDTHQINMVIMISEKFLDVNKELDITAYTLSNLLTKFFYFVFNSNTNIILSLMKKENYIFEKLCTDDIFTNDEKVLINRFLAWENIEKDHFVYKTISCCLDYCMMTIKKDNSSFRSLFNNKVFYLDANIIFRLTGLNKEERKKVMFSFVNKCKEVGIELKYTNVTYNEISSTVTKIVDAISKTLENNNPISTKAMKAMSSKYANLDFYDQYVEWIKKPNNKVGDYESFKDYLMMMISGILRLFKYESFDNYEGKYERNAFDSMCLNLKEHKICKKKDASDDAVKADIENYLFLREKNKKCQDNSFIELHNYLITADHCLVDWAKNRKKGSIPFVLLPSVWYSMILKFSGRSDDDYSAFTKF